MLLLVVFRASLCQGACGGWRLCLTCPKEGSGTTLAAELVSGLLRHQDRAKIVDVRARGTRDDAIADRLEECMRVVTRKVGRSVANALASTRDRVGCRDCAGDLLGAIDAVGVRGKCVNARATRDSDRQGEQPLDVAAAAAAFNPNGHGSL